MRKKVFYVNDDKEKGSIEARKLAFCSCVHYDARMNRKSAATRVLKNLDTEFVKAFSEPARIDILKHLLVLGPSDVKTLAEKMPQDRSVISRHLSVLHRSGFLDHRKEGRHSLYSVNGENTLKMADQFADTIRDGVQLGCC